MAKSKQNLSLTVGKAEYGVPVISKKTVKGTAESIYNNIVQGEVSALSVAELFKFTEEVVKELKNISDENDANSFTDLVIEEIKRNAEDGISCTSKYGTKFSPMESGYKYDYIVCNDPIWNSLNKQMVELKETMKARETMLKSIRGSMLISVPDPETGELLENIEIYPPAVSSTTTYKTELLKG